MPRIGAQLACLKLIEGSDCISKPSGGPLLSSHLVSVKCGSPLIEVRALRLSSVICVNICVGTSIVYAARNSYLPVYKNLIF